MPPHLLVEPLGDDIVTLASCLIIDALSFNRPGFVPARDLRRPAFRGWICRSTDQASPWGFLGSNRTRDGLHLTVVATIPEHRRKGVASALLRTAILHARQVRLSRVHLEVRPDNDAALTLYKKLDFVVAGRIEGYYGPDDDALSMVLPLAQPKPRLRTR